MASVAGYTNTVTCPYNSSHVIMKERLQTHLVKCAKNYPDIVLRKCPFNTTHLIHEYDMDDHVAKCEDRAALDLYKFNIQSKQQEYRHRQPDVQPIVTPVSESSENWDNDDHPTYDPQAYVENAPVIRQLNVAAPSERRAFREAERRRLNQMQ